MSNPPFEPFSDHTNPEADSLGTATAAAGDPSNTALSAESITPPFRVSDDLTHDPATISPSRVSDTVPHDRNGMQHPEAHPEIPDGDNHTNMEARSADGSTRTDTVISRLSQSIVIEIGAEVRREVESLRAEMARLRSETEGAFREPPPAYDQ